MNLRNYLVKVVAEFFYADLFLGRNEDTWSFFLCNPAVLELFKRAVRGLFGLQGEFVVGLVGVGVHFVENNVAGLV